MPQNYCVLIVGDEPTGLRSIRDRLVSGPESRFDVLETTDAAACLDLVEKRSPDCVLLSEGLSGDLELLARIARRTRPPAVVLVSEGDRPDRIVEAMKRGARNCVAREALDVTDLASVVRGAVDDERAARERAGSYERLELALAAASVSTWTWYPDSDRLAWDDFAPSVLGVEREELPRDLAQLLEHFHPDDRDALGDALRDAGAEPGGSFDVLARRCPTAECRTWSQLRGGASPEGETPRLLGACVDVTELQEARQATRRAAADTEHVLAAIHAVMVAVDGVDVVQRWNTWAGELFDMPASETIGRRLFDLDCGWDAAAMEAGVAACRSRAERIDLDPVSFQRPDGTAGRLGVGLTPMPADDGPPGVLLMARDVTAQLALEQQVARSRKLEAIGELAAGIAHEINTPTQYISDNTRFVKDSFGELRPLLAACALHAAGGEDTLAGLDAALAGADLDYLAQEIPQALTESLDGLERVATIVAAMKSLSHPGRTEKEPTDVNRLVRDAVTVTSNVWKYVADVEFELDESAPTVPAITSELAQVFLNLVVNAAHAIGDVVQDGEKGVVRIRTELSGDALQVTVEDTGPGVPSEIRERVFDPFFTTKEVGKGTGQGLAITHSVVADHHGGTIAIEDREGGGARFVIRLPLTAASAQTASEESAAC